MNITLGISESFDNFLKKIRSESTPPYWIVARLIPDVSTIDGIKTELEAERLLHRHFDKYDCSFLCSYNLDEIEAEKHKLWLDHLLKNHHSVIYAVEPKNAVAFDSDLLINA